MIRAVSFERTTFAPPPARFEAGTPHIAGAVGLAAAIQYVRGLGLERIAHAEHELLDYATASLSMIPGLRIVGTARAKASVLSFVLEGIHPHDIGTVLDHHGVAVRTGHHCAMPLMERLGVPATTRASFAFYNTRVEVDRLADALRAAREVLG
jgi:cysteine desulfurase/selenocysteine lyase